MTKIQRFFQMGGFLILLASLSGCILSQPTVTSIQVGPDALSLAAGATSDFSAVGTFTDGSKKDITPFVRWLSSDPSIATVGPKTGRVTAIKPGVATISASGGGFSSQGALVVLNPIRSIQIALAAATLPAGMTETATAIAVRTDNSQQNNAALFVWTSSDPTVATASTTVPGQLHGLKAGTVTVTATDPSSGVQGVATLTVNNARLLSMTVTAGTANAHLGSSIQFTATGAFSDGVSRNITELVTWSASAAYSTTPGSSLGLLTPQASGAFNVTASDSTSGLAGHLNYTVSAAVVTSIVITGPASTALGVPVTFTATGQFSDGSASILGGATWTSSNTAAATFAANQLNPLAAATGITITARDVPSGVTATASFDVTAAVLQSIVIDAGAGTFTAGDTQQLTAKGIYSDGTQPDITAAVTWSNDIQLAASVSTVAPTQGLLTTFLPGSAQITAAMPGTTLSATVGITVTP